MSTDRRILVIIFIGLFLVLTTQGSIWFFENYEYKEVESTSDYSPQARRNIFLAAEYFLSELELDVESDNSRVQLLVPHTPNETILLNDYGPKLSPTRFADLKRWVEEGGHLIMTASNFYYDPCCEDEENTDENEDKSDFENNQMLGEFGIQSRYTEFDDERPYPDEDIVPTYTLTDGSKVKVNFYPDYHLLDTQDRASFTLKDDFGIHLLQTEVGKGLLTVLSDNYFLRNYSIGKHDHAYLLWLLSTANKSPNSKIWLLYNIESDSIFVLL